MKKLSCTEWGADQNVLKTLFVGRIHPVLEYGMAASSTAAKSSSSKLSRVQHQAMRMMTGVMRSTPVSAMETFTGLQPLEDRQEMKVLTQAAKFKRLQDHPMHESANKGGLKRFNFLQHSRILKRRNSELLDHAPKPIPSVKTIRSWKRGQLPRMCIKVPGVADRGCQPEPERKSLTLEYVDIKYPEDQWKTRKNLPKGTDTPLTPMKRPSSKPSPRKNGSSNTQTITSQTASTN